jgi:nucleoside-diphosphate-sugar epimerase
VVVDLEEQSTIEALIGDFDAIIHVAAASYDTPERLMRITGVATGQLVEKAISLSIPRFVHVSGMSVYGQPSVSVVRSDTPVLHSSPYGAAKWAAECHLHEARQDIAGFSVRSPAIVGAHPLTHTHFLAKVHAHMCSDAKVCELSNPDFRFNNVIHEDTLAEFLVDLALSDLKGFGYCPVGSVPDESLREIIERIARHTGYRGKVEWVATESSPFAIGLDDAVHSGFHPISTSETIRRWLV